MHFRKMDALVKKEAKLLLNAVGEKMCWKLWQWPMLEITIDYSAKNIGSFLDTQYYDYVCTYLLCLWAYCTEVSNWFKTNSEVIYVHTYVIKIWTPGRLAFVTICNK
jgi:hypothetical protein